jgi:hypothetical protein
MQTAAPRIGWTRPDAGDERAKRLHPGVFEIFRLDGSQHVTGVFKKPRVGILKS